MIEGIVRGLEHRKHKPVIDGIVGGVPRKTKLKDSPDLVKVAPSATESSEGVFGAGRTPQGDGNGKAGPKGIKLAHHAEAAKPVLKKMATKASDMTHAM
jgi:hypothetical protein